MLLKCVYKKCNVLLDIFTYYKVQRLFVRKLVRKLRNRVCCFFRISKYLVTFKCFGQSRTCSKTGTPRRIVNNFLSLSLID